VEILTGFRRNRPAWGAFLMGTGSRQRRRDHHHHHARRVRQSTNELPKLHDRAYLERIWEYQKERFSDLHVRSGATGETALDIAVRLGREPANIRTPRWEQVAKLLRGMVVLPTGEVRR